MNKQASEALPRFCVDCRWCFDKYCTNLQVNARNSDFLSSKLVRDGRFSATAREHDLLCGLYGRYWEARPPKTGLWAKIKSYIYRSLT